MKKTRQNVFETNSSSTHSICIAQNTEVTLPESVHFEFGEFGWENDTLSSVTEKASYLYTGMVANDKLEEFNMMTKMLSDKGIRVSAQEKAEGGSYWDQGYVDHSGDLVDFLDRVIENEDALINYLFSDLSFVITGNDNDDSDVSIDVDYDHESYFKGN